VQAQPREVFCVLDRNNDGFVTAADLVFFFRKLSAKWRGGGNLHSELKLFSALDEEGEGRVSEEVAAACAD
jgi:hypothetical protein